MSRRRRQQAYRRGRWAESCAAWWLRLKGYRILEHDLRLPVGEIDLVARRGGAIAFVEVKRRADRQTALEAITTRQRQRIERAALAYLQARPHFATLRPRFDAVVIVPWRLPAHLPGAWRPTTH